MDASGRKGSRFCVCAVGAVSLSLLLLGDAVLDKVNWQTAGAQHVFVCF